LQLDKDKFVAALVNLLGNAAKYTPEGGRVTFSAGVTAHTLEIHVEDSGIGISESELPKIFDKFFRSDDDRVREIPGSGLGLAFVQEVARLHGATLDVHSELNKGTKFTLSLPLA
jgi:signal transduction histidine kinase